MELKQINEIRRELKSILDSGKMVSITLEDDNGFDQYIFRNDYKCIVYRNSYQQDSYTCTLKDIVSLLIKCEDLKVIEYGKIDNYGINYIFIK